MNKYIHSALKFAYALVEQFVFYFAAIVGAIVWITLNNVIIGVVVFLLICFLFWTLPSILNRKK